MSLEKAETSSTESGRGRHVPCLVRSNSQGRAMLPGP